MSTKRALRYFPYLVLNSVSTAKCYSNSPQEAKLDRTSAFPANIFMTIHTLDFVFITQGTDATGIKTRKWLWEVEWMHLPTGPVKYSYTC
jgi:hypothetical protein